MLTTSLLKVTTKITTFMTWEQYSTLYELINWKWIRQSHSWGVKWYIPWIHHHI